MSQLLAGSNADTDKRRLLRRAWGRVTAAGQQPWKAQCVDLTAADVTLVVAEARPLVSEVRQWAGEG